MKPVRLTKHAIHQCRERGTDEAEVAQAVRDGLGEAARRGRWMYRYNVPFNAVWQGRHYAVKQVAPVVAKEEDESVVVTVYTFYF